MTLAQKRRRRVELLIDQRLVGFLKPIMTVSPGARRLERKNNVTELRPSGDDTREDKAS